ncbi:MAG: oligoribonuclease [Corynebacterium sp.]|uniref:oligoribonuclease n=1 Tax=Corynebacterium sp. TaxID=1720 RepID=UPI0026DD783F|nr:oligoribonuclease [Corynebacterium sp.]MDO5030712.1 oligoribonuclease [Corynebacterium sp.]
MTQPNPDLQLPAEQDRIVWIDCEMTGLEPERHVIVEIAALVTDANLNILGEGVDIVVHASETELAQMDDFVTKMHANSGLDEEIRASNTNVADAEQAVLDYIRQWVSEPRTAPLAGNSIASDRKFIHRYMPELDQFLHYRMIDVSSFKELARRWYPTVLDGAPEKGLAHRALADIKESIRELDYYRRAMLVPHPGPDTDTIASAAEAASDKFGEIRG